MANQVVQGKSQAKPILKRPDDIFDLMRREIDLVFNRWGGDTIGWPAMSGEMRRMDAVVPDMDVTETPEQFCIEAELPGVDEKDVSVTLHDGVLTLHGEKKMAREEKNENCHLSERSFGSFTRQIRLPETADDAKIEAKFQNGLLKIEIPKRAEAVRQERKIEIKKA